MLTLSTMSFFGQALNNTSERRYAHRKPRLSESKENSLALPSGSGFVRQNLFIFHIKKWSGMTNSRRK